MDSTHEGLISLQATLLANKGKFVTCGCTECETNSTKNNESKYLQLQSSSAPLKTRSKLLIPLDRPAAGHGALPSMFSFHYRV